MISSQKYWIAVLVLLCAACSFLTYYCHVVLGVGTVFTHFYYLPTVLACLWFGKKGMWIVFLLILILLLSHHFLRPSVETLNDYFRSAVLLFVGSSVAFLSENLRAERKKLLEKERWYRTIFENTGTAIAIVDGDRTILEVNSELERLSGYRRDELEKNMNWLEFVSEMDQPGVAEYHYLRRYGLSQVPGNYEFALKDKGGGTKEVLTTLAMIPGTDKAVVSCADISLVKEISHEKEQLQERLTEALAKVLSGYIPICARCKKIRNDEGNWIQVEKYIADYTGALFSHGICPECMTLLYPELLDSKRIMISR